MKEFPIKALARIINAEPAENTGVFTGVSIDSRTTKPGNCFFAVAGDNFDGSDFIDDAFAKGASCAVVSRNLTGDNILKVKDTIKALGHFAIEYRRQCGFKVVAITGSAGKTTTRQITHHILSQHFRCHQAEKNFNNAIGLPLTILAADPQDQIIITELGSSYPGEIAYLTRIAQPDIAVITNVYPVHLAGFGDIETIVKEKSSIAEGLGDDGVLIINADFDRLIDTCRAKGTDFITFGKSQASNIKAQNITFNNAGSTFTIDGTHVDLPLVGPGNIENTLAAWSVCRQIGISIDDFADAVKTLPPVSMRAELLKTGTLTVLSDCYNANPASMKNALDILTSLNSTGNRRLVFICGDMAELGGQTKHLHEELGRLIARAKVQLLLTVGDYAKIAAHTAKRSANYDLQTKCFENTRSACNNLKEFIKDYDVVLVKGSRAAALETVVEKLKELFL